MKRNKHSLSHYLLSTFDMGQLIPVGHFDVLPGDSVRMATSCLLRVSPLVAPVMHPVQVRLHHWFVPFRLLWAGWEDFITGGPLGTGTGLTYPTFTTNGSTTQTSLETYLGVPHGVTGLNCSLLPVRAYNKIWNEYYRDQDLETVVGEDTLAVQRCSWEKDQFTAARPWTQKGPDVTVPLGGLAPIRGIGANASVSPTAGSFNVDEQARGNLTYTSVYRPWTANEVYVEADGNQVPAIFADLTGAQATKVNDLRRAFALQRYQEARAQYGSKYVDYLRYLGVRPSDARLQRPEYLGGGRATMQFSEVLRTASTGSDPAVGELRGHGISAVRSRRWVRFFEEHGIVMVLASLRPRSIYVDGLHRSWAKRTKEDYWQKELENIGQQPVLNQEVYAPHATKLGTFGFGPRYQEYRHQQSIVTGEFRTLLDYWHLARKFASTPALNASFVSCNPTKRVHAVQTNNVIWGMFNHSIQARRMVGYDTIGRTF